MKYVRIWIGVVVMLLVGLIHTPVSASSQKLLDDLARSPTVQAAQSIIDALWTEWNNAHQSEDERILMTRGMAGMDQGRLEDAENIFDDLLQKVPSSWKHGTREPQCGSCFGNLKSLGQTF
jgi:hypothetical protein